MSLRKLPNLGTECENLKDIPRLIPLGDVWIGSQPHTSIESKTKVLRLRNNDSDGVDVLDKTEWKVVNNVQKKLREVTNEDTLAKYEPMGEYRIKVRSTPKVGADRGYIWLDVPSTCKGQSLPVAKYCFACTKSFYNRYKIAFFRDVNYWLSQGLGKYSYLLTLTIAPQYDYIFRSPTGEWLSDKVCARILGTYFFPELSKVIGSKNYRYLLCFEQGTQNERPHFHIVFYPLVDCPKWTKSSEVKGLPENEIPYFYDSYKWLFRFAKSMPFVQRCESNKYPLRPTSKHTKTSTALLRQFPEWSNELQRFVMAKQATINLMDDEYCWKYLLQDVWRIGMVDVQRSKSVWGSVAYILKYVLKAVEKGDKPFVRCNKGLGNQIYDMRQDAIFNNTFEYRWTQNNGVVRCSKYVPYHIQRKYGNLEARAKRLRESVGCESVNDYFKEKGLEPCERPIYLSMSVHRRNHSCIRDMEQNADGTYSVTTAVGTFNVRPNEVFKLEWLGNLFRSEEHNTSYRFRKFFTEERKDKELFGNIGEDEVLQYAKQGLADYYNKEYLDLQIIKNGADRLLLEKACEEANLDLPKEETIDPTLWNN